MIKERKDEKDIDLRLQLNFENRYLLNHSDFYDLKSWWTTTTVSTTTVLTPTALTTKASTTTASSRSTTTTASTISFSSLLYWSFSTGRETEKLGWHFFAQLVSTSSSSGPRASLTPSDLSPHNLTTENHLQSFETSTRKNFEKNLKKTNLCCCIILAHSKAVFHFTLMAIYNLQMQVFDTWNECSQRAVLQITKLTLTEDCVIFSFRAQHTTTSLIWLHLLT